MKLFFCMQNQGFPQIGTTVLDGNYCLKKEIRDGVHLMHAAKLQLFIQLDSITFDGCG